jgi:hypothetical protein
MITWAKNFLVRNLRKIKGTPQEVAESLGGMLKAEIALSKGEGASAAYVQEWEDALLMLVTLGPERTLRELRWGRRTKVGVGPPGSE